MLCVKVIHSITCPDVALCTVGCDSVTLHCTACHGVTVYCVMHTICNLSRCGISALHYTVQHVMVLPCAVSMVIHFATCPGVALRAVGCGSALHYTVHVTVLHCIKIIIIMAVRKVPTLWLKALHIANITKQARTSRSRFIILVTNK